MVKWRNGEYINMDFRTFATQILIPCGIFLSGIYFVTVSAS